jgi:CheY-like chemotaxis protein
VVILIAEDDDGHAELIREGLEEAGVQNPIERFRNGQEAWDYLSHLATNKKKDPNAYLLLLDINMPIMDGIEVLRRIKMNPVLMDIPVIMLTTTDDPREIEACYKIGCNIYITKPVDFVKFSETLRRLGLFVQIVKL